MVNTVSWQENRAAHGIMATHGIMPHGTSPNLKSGVVHFSREKVALLLAHNFDWYERKLSM